MRAGTLHLLRAATLAGAAVLALGPARAQTTPAAEADHRAAVRTVLKNQSMLAMLAIECASLLPDKEKGAIAIARGWQERNRPLLEATVVWLDRYLAQQSGGQPEARARAVAELGAASEAALREETRKLFKRQRPDEVSCRAALAPYASGAHDIQPPAAVKPTPQQQQLLARLQQLRQESGFALPQRLRPLIQPGPMPGPLASAEAAAAARERGDGRAAAEIYLSMANRGDGAAAQTLGLMMLEGKLLPANPPNAYRWFYIAWTLGEPEGLNALGVLQRDGVSVPPNPRMAYAAFHLAAARARTPEARARALANAEKLRSSLSNDDRLAAACMTLGVFSDELIAPIAVADRPQDRTLLGTERRLGELAPAIAAGLNMVCV